jgi:hypothetical protein
LVRTGCRASGNLPAAGELVPVGVSPLGYLHPSAIMRISRESAWVDCSCVIPIVDRMRLMSAFGTKRTSQSTQLMSPFGGKADIANSPRDVRF